MKFLGISLPLTRNLYGYFNPNMYSKDVIKTNIICYIKTRLNELVMHNTNEYILLQKFLYLINNIDNIKKLILNKLKNKFNNINFLLLDVITKNILSNEVSLIINIKYFIPILNLTLLITVQRLI